VGEKLGGDGGGALLKGHGGEAAEGEGPAAGVPRGSARPWGLAPTGGRRPDHFPAVTRAGGATLFEQERGGGARSLMCGTWLAVGEGGRREERGHVGQPGKRNGVG
jgi:hypothetical protein